MLRAWCGIAVVFLILLGCGSRDSGETMRLGSEEEFAQTLAKARELSKKPLEAFIWGDELTEKDRADLRESSKLFRALVSFDPLQFAPHLALGKIEYALGNLAEAKKSLDQGMKLMPERGSRETIIVAGAARDDLANVALLQGDLDEAEANALDALSLIQGEPSFLATYASVLLQKGRVKEAQEQIDRALERQPQNKRALRIQRLIRASNASG